MHPQHKSIDPVKPSSTPQARTWTQAILFNSTAIVLVVLAGVAGFYLSPAASTSKPHPSQPSKTPAESQAEALQFSLWGQIFGYVCAVLYLGSRVPQLLLNYRRKSTEGLNALFFMFACIGNLTYVLSIFAFEPVCADRRDTRGHHGAGRGMDCLADEARAVYARYVLVNLSWLLGSLGTLFLDGAVFVQFWIYRGNNGGAVAVRDANPEDAPHGV